MIPCAYKGTAWAYEETGTLAAWFSVGKGAEAAVAAAGVAGSPTSSFMGFQKSFRLHSINNSMYYSASDYRTYSTLLYCTVQQRGIARAFHSI